MRIAVAAGLALAAAGPALAAGLAAREARTIFFGFDMAGYVEGDKQAWRECIKPSGETSYWFGGTFDQGRLRVRADGHLCFSNQSTGFAREACFSAQRMGADNWRFTDETDPQSVFVTTRTRKVNSCPDNRVPMS